MFLTLGLALAAPSASAQTAEENDSAAAAARKAKSLPLIPTRTLEFTTDEGSWISLDLSPDGETLVFELLGDLYTLPVTGGEATRITSGLAYDMQPRFSPDGSQIVFVSDRNGSENVWIADADGSDARALTTGARENYMSPVWEPGGEYVVSVKGSQLWLFHTEGGSGVQITGTDEDGPTPAHLGPAFGPDPDLLWVNLRGRLPGGLETEIHGVGSDVTDPEWHGLPSGPEGPRSSARELGRYQVGVLDRETGRVRVRTHEMEGAFRAVPSPDGRWLVYATRWDDRQALKLLDLETREESWLVMGVQRDDSQGGGSRDRDVYPGSAWTPDSRALITSYGGRIMRVEVPSGEATEIPFTARIEQDLGPEVKFDYPVDDSLLTVTQIRGARPSPDGETVVFSALDRLWVADLPVLPEAPEAPESPEAREPGGGGASAGADRPGGGAGEESADRDEAAGPDAVVTDARRLTSADVVEHAPVWSPDGRWIAYVTWSDSAGGNIYRLRADGTGEPERLTPTAAFFDKIAYSRDGTRIMGVQGSKMHRMRMLEDFGGHSAAAELEYMWLPADGGEPTRIAWTGSGTTQQGRNAPHPGPDPERVYIWDGSDGLVSMRWDGTDPRTVVKVQGPPAPRRGPGTRPATPDEVLLSPDGDRALVRANRNVYMVTVPPVGGDAPTVSVTGSSMPARALTDIGGDFIGWSPDGAVAHWSIGRSFFRYDVPLADSLVSDSIARARREGAEEEGRGEEGEAGEPGTPDDPGDPGDPDDPGDPEGEAAAGDEADDEDEDDSVYEPHRTDVEIVVARDRPRGTVALTGARLLTMREGEDEVVERGDIVVRDNRIVAVGPSGSVDIPDDARVFDVAGRTIMPGLVDIHAHTWVAWGVHRSQVSQFLAQLAYGVTTQRDPQTSSEDVLAYSDLVETGEILGPRIYSTGPGVFSSDNIKSLDDARNVLRRYADHFNTKTIKQYLAGDRKVRQWVVMAARELGLTPTTEGGSNFTMNLTLMQDGYSGLEHSLPISPFYEDVDRLGAFSGIYYTPTLIVAYGGPSGRSYYLTRTDVDGVDRLRRFTPHDELDKWQSTTWYRRDQYVHFLHAEEMVDWVEAGGRVGLGSHGEVQGLGTHWELWMMASGGMDEYDALRAATIHSADAIGLDGDLGSLEVGKLADLIVLDENPLDDLENTTSIRWVMKNGRLYEGDTLDEVWPRQQELPTQWWWRVEPPGERPGR